MRGSYKVRWYNMAIDNELKIEQFGEGNMLQYFKMEIEHILNQINGLKAYKICFSDNKSFNAKVRIDGKMKTIEINIGVIMFIYHLSFLVMMNEKFFPGLGEGETMNQTNIYDFELPKIELREDKFKEINFYSGPSDPKRAAVAQVIAMFGTEFVLFHEMGHILGGHLEYIKDILGIHELLAQGSEQVVFEKTNDDETYQTIEMDADAIAIHLLLENTLCKRKQIIDTFLEGMEINLSKLIIIAIVISFFLMSTDSEFQEVSVRYLPRDYRFHLVLSKFLSKIKKEYRMLTNSAEDISDVVKICLECNEFLAKLYNTRKICEIPSTELDSYYYNIILNKWKSIRADVQKYASIILPE